MASHSHASFGPNWQNIKASELFSQNFIDTLRLAHTVWLEAANYVARYYVLNSALSAKDIPGRMIGDMKMDRNSALLQMITAACQITDSGDDCVDILKLVCEIAPDSVSDTQRNMRLAVEHVCGKSIRFDRNNWYQRGSMAKAIRHIRADFAHLSNREERRELASLIGSDQQPKQPLPPWTLRFHRNKSGFHLVRKSSLTPHTVIRILAICGVYIETLISLASDSNWDSLTLAKDHERQKVMAIRERIEGIRDRCGNPNLEFSYESRFRT